MVSTLDSQKFASRNALTMYEYDPGATTAADIAWVDMRDYEGIHVTAFLTVGTAAIGTFSLLGNSASDGSGSDVTLKTSAATTADAVGDYIHLAVTAAELAALGTDLRYVSASVALGAGTDEAVVTYVRYNSKHATADLTADTIA